MNCTMRPIRSDDLVALLAMSQAYPDASRHVVDLPYRLCSPALDRESNGRLWEDERGGLAGWALWQPPFVTLDYITRPDAPELAETILTWGIGHFEALAREKGERLWYCIDAREDDAWRRALLERHNFIPSGHWQQLHLSRALDTLITSPAMPSGFSIRPLAGEDEIDSYVALHHAAFESTNMTTAWRTCTLRAPHHVRDADLLAVAPDGKPAGFCLCWLDAHDPGHVTGQIEPLGVLPTYQGRGLGRALLMEGLRRLQAHGAHTAEIEVDSVNPRARQLYKQAGFRTVYTALKYYREF